MTRRGFEAIAVEALRAFSALLQVYQIYEHAPPRNSAVLLAKQVSEPGRGQPAYRTSIPELGGPTCKAGARNQAEANQQGWCWQGHYTPLAAVASRHLPVVNPVGRGIE